jgi:hypothetical protein
VSGNKLEMKGLSELRAALRQLPEELAREAHVIVTAQAQFAKDQIQRAYPEGRTGNLRGGVTVQSDDQRYGASAIVRSRAKHSHLYEYGTAQRRTSNGANRGRMPQAPEANRMIPIVVRRRRAMTQALIDLVRRAGFTVEGKA